MSWLVTTATATLGSFIRGASALEFTIEQPKLRCHSNIVDSALSIIAAAKAKFEDGTRAGMLRSMVAAERAEDTLRKCYGLPAVPQGPVPPFSLEYQKAAEAMASLVYGQPREVRHVIHISEAKAFVAAEEAAKKFAESLAQNITNTTATDVVVEVVEHQDASILRHITYIVDAIGTPAAIIASAGLVALTAYGVYILCSGGKEKK